MLYLLEQTVYANRLQGLQSPDGSLLFGKTLGKASPSANIPPIDYVAQHILVVLSTTIDSHLAVAWWVF